MKRFQPGVDGFNVSVELVIQQAALRWADPLAALGKLLMFKGCDS